ncbi:MAG: cation diffusion facilitator family transporter [Chlorobi bacterium]|nr:cation diffusion facilitator family transporter [Chlorobiota bacterium]
MTAQKVFSEKSILRISVVANLLLAAVAIYYGIITGSEAIKLDGYYSFAGFILALISLWVIKIVLKPGSSTFNFGYSVVEPLFNLVKGLLILAVVLSSSINAVKSLLSGGNTPAFGESIVYFFIATITCLALTILFYYQNKKITSPVIYVEYKNWFVDTIISLSIGVAFVTSYFFQDSSHASWIKYTDPVITLAVVVFIIKLPLSTIKTGVKEVLLSAPDKKILEKINTVIKNVISEYNYEDYNFKATKTGREIYLLVHIQVVNPDDLLYSIRTQDQVREKIKTELEKLFDMVKIDVAFSEMKIDYNF